MSISCDTASDDDPDTTLTGLHDCVESLCHQQAQAKEAVALLEKRVCELERRLVEPWTQPREGADPQLAVGDCVEPGKDTEDGKGANLEYALGTTLWDAPALVGLPALGGPFVSVAFLLGFLLNLFLQGFLCYVITREDFIQARRWKDLVGDMERWRHTQAHEYSAVDASGVSLASRVCSQDGSLSVSSSQESIAAEINTYLQLEPNQLSPEGLGVGPLLCGACLVLFGVLMIRELRSWATALLAVCSLRRGRTRFEDGRLAAISRPRFACFVAASLVRAGVAGALLFAGVKWLSYTTSITDLILNAAALGFVLDMDEFLLDTVVPAVVHKFVADLPPLRYRRPPYHLEAIIPTLLLLGVTTASVLTMVEPNISDMLAVKNAMCSGLQNFAIEKNAAGFVVGRMTTSFESEDSPPDTLKVTAVKELVSSHSNFDALRYTYPAKTDAHFQRYSTYTAERMAEEFPCEDLDTYHDGLMLSEFPSLFVTARFKTGIHKGLSLAEAPWRCADYAGHCDANSLLRALCPLTCGCSDALSGLNQGAPTAGCPVECQERAEAAVRGKPCADMQVVGTSSWTRYWTAYRKLMQDLSPRRAGSYVAYVAQKLSLGCNDTTRDPVGGHDFCDETEGLVASLGVSPIVAFCPATCCDQSRATLSAFCPTACSR